jgi:hypothetical protein
MTRKTRQVLLALAVTTALCADHVSAAAPTLRPQVAELAGRIVTKLSHSFRQSVHVELPENVRRDAPTVEKTMAVAPASADLPYRFVSPFESRLPPPVL